MGGRRQRSPARSRDPPRPRGLRPPEAWCPVRRSGQAPRPGPTAGTTRNFTIRLSHLDSFYFALGTLSTAGTGNISAISETTRRLQAAQMGVDLILIGFVVTLFLARYSALV
ncbi:MAG: two pore domain potassium channel family protein [Actinobacteria bacterium]|nr:two pore domain potassium channel family protein [Actinomycetota bacterium]